MSKLINFSEALNEVKKGAKIARRGWNGKNMFVFLTHGEINVEPLNKDKTEKFEQIIKDPHLDMRRVNGNIQVGWAPTQSDLLAEDWYVVE